MTEPLKVGLAGLGTVGSAVVELLERGRDKLIARCGRPIEVVAVSARSRSKEARYRSEKIPLGRRSGGAGARSGDRCVCRAHRRRGRSGQSARWRRALAAGKPVVTANKALLARHGQKLAALAGAPSASRSISKLRSAAAFRSSRLCAKASAAIPSTRIYGILNGTCNYILSRMEQDRLAFDDCLRDAQRLGYAEADPTFDVEGHDTAQKLSILASLAFGTKLDPRAIYVEGISSITLADLDAAERARLSRQAARRRGEDRGGHRAARAPDHGAEGFRHRPGHGRDQCGDGRCRRAGADHAGRPRRRRHGDGLGRGVRSRRYRLRRAHAAVRPAGRAHDRGAQSADAAPRRRLLHPAVGARSAGHGGDHRAAAGAAEHFAGIHRAASRHHAAGTAGRAVPASRCRLS